MQTAPCNSPQTCQNGQCVNPTCSGGCNTPPGATCQDANTRATYGSVGTCNNGQCSYTATLTGCPYGCWQGVCQQAQACTPNSTRCNGTQVETCNANGTAWLFTQNCPSTCANGLCDAPCTPNATRCNGSNVETCNSGGTAWQQTSTCTSGCLSGACLTDQLVVDGTTVTMDGEHHYSSQVVVKNAGSIQVGTSHSLTLYAPSIDIEISSSITGSASGATCAADPDNVAQGIRLYANQVTINGLVSWSGSGCSKDGVVVRADTINGSGSVTSSARSLVLYGTGGVATGLSAAGATKSLMPPAQITSVDYPGGGTYNDDGPPPIYSWDRPYSTVAGYYYVAGTTADAVPNSSSSTFINQEALALASPPAAGTSYLDVVTLDANGVVGTVPHQFAITVVNQPPALSSSTHTQGTYNTNNAVVMAWSGGNPGLGYYYVFDHFPTTRPTPQTGTFEPTNKSPAQVLLQSVANGQWWFHMIALDSMGYATLGASHYEVDIGTAPSTGTIAGTVKDSGGNAIVGATVVVQRGVYSQTTVAGGVYTFNNTLPAGTYEVVAEASGMQSQQQTLTVTAGQTTDANFVLASGSGCPSCSDLCSGVACPSTTSGCAPLWDGTCRAGACEYEFAVATCPVGYPCTSGSQCASGYCGNGGTCVSSCQSSRGVCYSSGIPCCIGLTQVPYANNPCGQSAPYYCN